MGTEEAIPMKGTEEAQEAIPMKGTEEAQGQKMRYSAFSSRSMTAPSCSSHSHEKRIVFSGSGILKNFMKESMLISTWVFYFARTAELVGMRQFLFHEFHRDLPRFFAEKEGPFCLNGDADSISCGSIYFYGNSDTRIHGSKNGEHRRGAIRFRTGFGFSMISKSRFLRYLTPL